MQNALDEVVHGKGVVIAEGTCKREQADNADNQQDGKGDETAERKQHPTHRRAHRDPGEACDRLAGNGDVGVLFKIITLDEKDDQRRNDEEYGKDGAHREIPCADYLCVSLCRKYVIIRSHQHRIAEVGEAVDGDQQESAGQARRRQTQRDGTEQIKPFGAEVLRR